MASVPAAKRIVERVTTERLLLQMCGSGVTRADIAGIVDGAEVRTVRKGETIIDEGGEGDDVFAIRSGSMVVEKLIGGKAAFLSYLPAGTYVGEMRCCSTAAAAPRQCAPRSAPRWCGSTVASSARCSRPDLR